MQCKQLVNWLKDWFTPTDELLDTIYPIGSIYMSVNSTSPSTLFGGTWVQLQDTFLYATSTTADTGTTAPSGQGSKDAVVVEHNHTQKSHNHTQNAHNHLPGTGRQFLTAPSSSGWTELKGANVSGSGYWYLASDTSNCNVYTQASGDKTATNQAQTAENNPSGESGTDKNMPPYMKVYMWKRTG